MGSAYIKVDPMCHELLLVQRSSWIGACDPLASDDTRLDYDEIVDNHWLTFLTLIVYANTGTPFTVVPVNSRN